MLAVHRYQAVQAVAKDVLTRLGASIGPTDTERSIAERATRMLAEQGIQHTWYYQCPALVLLGSRSCLSVSGKHYRPSDEVVGTHNLVTVDLSPLQDGVWGDCARSFVIEQGRCVAQPQSAEFVEGLQVLRHLHSSMRDFVSPTTRFDELFTYANQLIAEAGFENLDFLGNVGHSIETALYKRHYIEAGNTASLDDVRFFTFEPHVRRAGGRWGFKHEDIYYFHAERGLNVL